MKRRMSLLALMGLFFLGLVVGAVQQNAFAAKMAGNVAFMLVYDQTAGQLNEARQLIREAIKMAPGTVKVEVDRSDPANAQFVKDYRLAGAPVPLILVMLPSGVITGGKVASQLTVERLAGMVPSPKKAEAVQALSEGKAVFMTFSRKSMKANASVSASCQQACQQMAGKSAFVAIDIDDSKEARFVEEMKIDKTATEPVTFVANPQGQISQKYSGSVQAGDLIASATKRVAGCGPAGCGPTGCGPKK